MDIEKLIERFEYDAKDWAGDPHIKKDLTEAATALSTLQDENAEMQKQLNEFSEFLCRMTGNLLSKTNYTAQAMIEAAEDYQQRVCDDCDLRAELEQVKRLYESEKEDFIDFVCSGVPNLSPYCLNRHPDCVDERGWCRAEKCRGFSRERGQKED